MSGKNRRVKYTRTVATPDGGSRFEEVEVASSSTEVVPGRPAFASSAAIPTAGATLLHIEAGWDGDWHPTPKRWFVATLAGELEVTTTDGEVRRFGPGGLLLLEDTAGRGHNTRVLTDWTGFGVDLADQSPEPAQEQRASAPFSLGCDDPSLLVDLATPNRPRDRADRGRAGSHPRPDAAQGPARS